MRFPVYVVSKGRSDHMITSRALAELSIPHTIIVEPEEELAYRSSAVDLQATVLVLNPSYKHGYELCDDFGFSKSTGPGPARNYAWDHAVAQGYTWHWVMDDNIRSFRRWHRNMRVKVADDAIFRAMEDFVLRFENIAMAGPAYSFFAYDGGPPPFVVNTRIYSCNLIRNDVPFRWRGRYNEDTILALDVLKAGWDTIQFNAFMQEKLATQTIGGGNTDEFYAAEGTMPKSEMLAKIHPDVAKVSARYGRTHHSVNYRPFKRELILKTDLSQLPYRNEYGMRLVQRAEMR